MIKKICCIGAGYVGGPTMAVIAYYCPEIDIHIVDSNKERIDLWNSDNLDNIPVKEPGLPEIISKVRGKNLFFTNEVDKYIDLCEMIFIAVNTPTKTSGEGKGMAADLKNIINCAKQISLASKSDKIIVEKSTLPVRTAEKIKEILENNKKEKINFEIISNPEFLAEGTAIQDLFKSDRVLIGAEQTESGKIAQNKLIDIYKKWIPEDKIIKTNVWSSELSKLASNAMLAQRISSINSLSALAEKSGAKIDELSMAIGKDHRIGNKFLNASVGFGGSCFQKDILNLVYISRQYGLDEVADYWHNVVKINEFQKDRFSQIIIRNIKTSSNQIVSVLGWAFKKDTNDSRESSSISVTSNLLLKGLNVKVYDPLIKINQIYQDITTYLEFKNINQKNISKLLQKLTVNDNLNHCLIETDAIAFLTEWDIFLDIEWSKFSKNQHNKSKPKIFDGRGIINQKHVSSLGYQIYQIGNGDNTIN
ncbi:nucleotide sugar dehydrogenase [Flavobacteriaceae bacterium]|nr:nucleotide sugar dehydrogenase [Flavobacteriaceae bacterium]